MNFLTLNIPPGVKSHGVDLDSIGRWIDSNLVRWSEGSMRPVNGWLAWSYNDSGTTTDIVMPASSGVMRAAHAWFDNSENEYFATASFKKVIVSEPDGTVTDITISDLTEGYESSGENLGYGGKAYGKDLYGTSRTADGSTVPATVWALDNWGEFLVGVSEEDTRILVWELNTASDMTALSVDADGSIPSCKSLVVTQERFLMALRADGNPRKVQWCDREDFTTWAPATTNEAGDFELPTNGVLERAVRVRNRTLIVTTTDAHVAIYQGPPIVYGFQRVGTGCGIAAPMTLVAVDGAAFWMGNEAFYVYDGSKVVELPCDVLDKVFDSIDRSEIRTAWGVANQRHSEVWWFYRSAGADEIDRYVAYDYGDSIWLVGELDRTTGVDLGVFNRPLWVDASGNVYRHEIGNLYDGSEPYAESGPVMMGDGFNVLHATQLLVDERVAGNCRVEFTTRFYPDGPETDHGPYELTSPPTDVRFTGRQFRMKVIGDEGEDWRFGPARLAVVAGGRR